MRIADGIVMAAALALGGCNMVVSDEPWLTRSDQALKMKPGVWVELDKPDCDYDQSAPVAEWPSCADPALITEDGRFFGYEGKTASWNEIEVILDSETPTVVQVRMPAEFAARAPEAPTYFYAGMRAVETDANGHVTAMRSWLLVCGPVDNSEPPEGEMPSGVTKAPFAGLTIVGENCHADDLDALRNAAAESEALDDDANIMHWVKHADAGMPE